MKNKKIFSEIPNQQRKYTQPVPHGNQHSSFFPPLFSPLILTAPTVTTYTEPKAFSPSPIAFKASSEHTHLVLPSSYHLTITRSSILLW